MSFLPVMPATLWLKMEKNLRGSYRLNEEVVKNSKATRQALLSRGIKPESLKPQEDLKKIVTRHQKLIK